MSQPLVVKISVNLGPNNNYSEGVYKFERTKTMGKNTQQEFADFLDNVVTAIKSESSKLTILQAAFIEHRSHALNAQARMQELEDKSGKDAEEPAESF